MKISITHERNAMRIAGISAAFALSIALWVLIVMTGKLVWTLAG
jgi:hypothetical protein